MCQPTALQTILQGKVKGQYWTYGMSSNFLATKTLYNSKVWLDLHQILVKTFFNINYKMYKKHLNQNKLRKLSKQGGEMHKPGDHIFEEFI